MMISGTGPLDDGTEITLWITAIILFISTIFFAGRSFRVGSKIKHYYYASALITLIAGTFYLLMASGYGSILQGQHLFFYARYIDWAFTTPLLLLDLAFVALPKNFPNRRTVIATMLAADLYMIITGLIASAIRSDFRWAFFAISCTGFLAVLYFIYDKLSPQAALRSKDVSNLYALLVRSLVVLWLCYPLVWFFGPTGFGLISVFVEALLYAILDVLSKVVYGYRLVGNNDTLLTADEEAAPIELNALSG